MEFVWSDRFGNSWPTGDIALALLELGPKTGARLMMPRLGEPVEPAHAQRVEPWWRVD